MESTLGGASGVVSDRDRCAERRISVSFNEVDRTNVSMTRGKLPGHDGLSTEHLEHV